MRLIYDNIIFPPQSGEGISLIWFELLKRFLNEAEIGFNVINNK